MDLDTLLVGHLDPEGHIYHHIPISIALLILAAIAAVAIPIESYRVIGFRVQSLRCVKLRTRVSEV